MNFHVCLLFQIQKDKFFSPSDLELLSLLFITINISIDIRAFEHGMPSYLVTTFVWTFFRIMSME